ncbi:retrovirus-related Pol polyprotein from transposon 297 [Trichonephila clavipes]|uniref:RNA-directed DNA polymerase n=1 Tax=Trichonephila clavipes TaxID=2585209 RepID=A0A8X6VHJ6_TRICX|nr:retrovirus-related Pol polyprotein from transposon 297 [Trichonephila clavipes]
MPFGLSGAAPNFQRAIDIILQPVIGRFVSVYMDDVIITSPSFKDHLDHLTRVFTLLRDAGLTLNKEKCHFARDKLKYLGLIISKEGIETDNKKIRAITEMKPPKNNREVSKFLGMTGWYQKFIPRYADICEPLYQLKKKGAKFNWSGEAQDSFDQIKRTLTEAPILQLPNFSEQFNLFTDASGVGIGAVLQQNQKPIAFASRTLNKAERNYTVTERECLAVIWALNKFKTYFGPLPVKVITDHAALTKLTNGKNLSSRMIRWALKLSEFNIEWEHRPGVQNVVADLFLSRNPVDSVEGSQISCAALRALAINSREQFIKEQREDPELGHIYRYLENPDDGSVNATVCESWSQDFKLINGLLFYAKYFSNLGELRVYIPGSLRKDIMKEFHDLPLAGHLGKRKTYLKLRSATLKNGDRYRAMIANFFIPELNNHDVQELWFQQDGATYHTARATIHLLKDTFGDRLISRFVPVNWPPRSLDLTPLDYFLWGYVKSLVYAHKPQTLDHLEDNIRRVIADIRPQMLEKVFENWTSRLDYIRASRGSPMPEIIFKM